MFTKLIREIEIGASEVKAGAIGFICVKTVFSARALDKWHGVTWRHDRHELRTQQGCAEIINVNALKPSFQIILYRVTVAPSVYDISCLSLDLLCTSPPSCFLGQTYLLQCNPAP